MAGSATDFPAKLSPVILVNFTKQGTIIKDCRNASRCVLPAFEHETSCMDLELE